ncbi:MAG: Na+/H+ antiporter NhaC family protein [Clostridiales bacterium]|nr:Na+/H+ antiporter NhaC family protein [Clostridiales bacterium]
MDIMIGMAMTFFILIISIFTGIFLGFPLLIGLIIFMYIAWKRGFPIKEILTMSYIGGKKAFVVLKILVLIGALTAIWMAAGTVPVIVYYGIQFMNPKLFILYAFLISAAVSLLLGTSLGTAGTVGLALIVLAKGGNVNTNIAAGAIIAGAYFGDRCSPMSSSAHLVANITGTKRYTNIRNMLKSSIIPFVLSFILYALISINQPLSFVGSSIDADILEFFNTNLIVLVPSMIIIVFSIFKVNVKLSMLLSIISAAIISFTVQHYSLSEITRFLFLGFRMEPENPLYTIIQGGGILSMWKPSVVILISCALAGIFEGTGMLKTVEDLLVKARSRSELFSYTAGMSILTAAFGCSQTISVVLTNQLMSRPYKEKGLDQYKLALDLENTGIVLSALIPWNLAAFVPTTTMNVSSVGFIPYAFYLYLLPISSFIYFKLSKTQGI